MKRIGLIAVLAALAAASAHAQQQFEPAVPKGLPESRVEPSAELPQPPQSVAPRSFEPIVITRSTAAPQLVMDPRHRNDADARECLRFSSNMQVLRCAERYRAHGAHARVTKASAKHSSAVSRAERVKASDSAKPALSQAAEPAKPVDMKSAAAPSTTSVIAPASKSADAGKAPPEKAGAKGK